MIITRVNKLNRRWKANWYITMPPLGGDKEEGKQGKGQKILTLSKLLTRFSVLLAPIERCSNSYELKNEIKQILFLLYEHNKIIKLSYNKLIKSL